MLDTASCRKQEQECLSLAASTTNTHKRLYAEMAKMWYRLGQEADSSVALRRFLEQIIR